MLHVVWGVKKRQQLLSADIRPSVLEHIRANATENSISLDFINCHLDHFHGLLSLGRDQNIQQIVKLLKGESSHWINQQRLTPGRFLWQQEYFAGSVSESQLLRVREYIRNQDYHHRNRDFQHEFNELLRVYGFPISNRQTPG